MPLTSDQVREILSPHPLAIAIYNNLVDFFGNGFLVEKQVTGSQSTFVFDIDPYPLVFKKVVACVVVDAGNVPASLTHELLHLKLGSLGFPRLYGINNVDPILSAGQVQVIYTQLSNVVDHDIFLDEFLATGLPRGDFLRRMSKRENPEELISVLKDSRIKGLPKKYARPRYYFEYLKTWITGNHLHNLEDLEIANRLEAGAREWLDPMGTDLERIRQWFQIGAHRSPETYVESSNHLLGILGLPPATFYHLERSISGQIMAVL